MKMARRPGRAPRERVAQALSSYRPAASLNTVSSLYAKLGGALLAAPGGVRDASGSRERLPSTSPRRYRFHRPCTVNARYRLEAYATLLTVLTRTLDLK